MALDLFIKGTCIGSVIRGAGAVYAYTPAGAVVGQFASTDAAAIALAALAGIKDSAHAA